MWQKLFIVCLFFLNGNSLTDHEVETLIDDLKQTILGSISVAKLQLNNLAYDVESFQNNVELQGEFDLMEHDQRMKTQLMQIKQSATTSKLNVTECLDTYEHELEEMVLEYIDQIDECIDNTAKEKFQIYDDGLYAIDILMTNIYLLQFLLNQCSTNNETCLSNVIENINVQRYQLPLKIELELTKIEEHYLLVKTEIQNCAKTYLSNYAAEAVKVIFFIFDCIFLP